MIGNGVLLVGFLVITGLTFVLVTHQMYRLKQFDMKQRAREEAREHAAHNI